MQKTRKNWSDLKKRVKKLAWWLASLDFRKPYTDMIFRGSRTQLEETSQTVAGLILGQSLFVCLFVGVKPDNLYFASRPGLEVNPLGVYPLGSVTFLRSYQRYTAAQNTLFFKTKTIILDRHVIPAYSVSSVLGKDCDFKICLRL